MFRIQDKGSRLVVKCKERYKRKMLDYLEDVSIFQENGEDQCQANMKKVNDWVRKWEYQEQLGGEKAEWILTSKTRPAKAYANIKTDKEGWRYRYIISCNREISPFGGIPTKISVSTTSNIFEGHQALFVLSREIR